MLLCFVIISNIINVPEMKRKGTFLKEPPFIEGRHPLRYDTTAKDKRSMNVIVKFENHTFYPAYVIHFVKTLCTSPPDTLYANNSASNLSYSKDNVVEKRKVAPPFSKISADVPLPIVSRPDPTPILNPLTRIPTRSTGTFDGRQVSLSTSCMVPRHQGIIVRNHQEVSRPTPYLLPRHQESIAPKKVSSTTPPVVPRRRQENIAARQVFSTTPHVVPSRRQEGIVPQPAPGTNAQFMSFNPRIPVADAPILNEGPIHQSRFMRSLRSFFRKVCCCSSNKN